jgi:hypothetical protein
MVQWHQDGDLAFGSVIMTETSMYATQARLSCSRGVSIHAL